jgi:hypothetical protein
MRDVVIVGGGCYGTFYAGQLAKAKAKGLAAFRTVVVVDRDPGCRARRELPEAPDRRYVEQEWDRFFDGYLHQADPVTEAAQRDYIVPSPHMPHLMFDWLVRRARARFPGRAVEVVPVPEGVGSPYDRTGPTATRFVSFADWICPTHCVEPARCPAIGAPRTWEMSDAVTALARRLQPPVHGPALFVCRHHVFGVGTFSVDAVLEGDRIVGEAGASADQSRVLVGTISSCHGALNLLSIGPLPS